MTRFSSTARLAIPFASGGRLLCVLTLFVLALAFSALSVSSAAVAQVAAPLPLTSQIGETEQFDGIRVTLRKVAIHGAEAEIILYMENLSDEEERFAFLQFVDARSETGELGSYDYAATRCDGIIEPKGDFVCWLGLVFPAPPKEITLRVGEDMTADVATFTLWP